MDQHSKTHLVQLNCSQLNYILLIYAIYYVNLTGLYFVSYSFYFYMTLYSALQFTFFMYILLILLHNYTNLHTTLLSNYIMGQAEALQWLYSPERELDVH